MLMRFIRFIVAGMIFDVVDGFLVLVFLIVVVVVLLATVFWGDWGRFFVFGRILFRLLFSGSDFIFETFLFIAFRFPVFFCRFGIYFSELFGFFMFLLLFTSRDTTGTGFGNPGWERKFVLFSSFQKNIFYITKKPSSPQIDNQNNLKPKAQRTLNQKSQKNPIINPLTLSPP